MSYTRRSSAPAATKEYYVCCNTTIVINWLIIHIYVNCWWTMGMNFFFPDYYCYIVMARSWYTPLFYHSSFLYEKPMIDIFCIVIEFGSICFPCVVFLLFVWFIFCCVFCLSLINSINAFYFSLTIILITFNRLHICRLMEGWEIFINVSSC